MSAIRSLALAAILGAALAPAGVAARGNLRNLSFTLDTRQGPTSIHPHPPAGEIGDSFVSSLQLVNGRRAQFGRAAHAVVGTMQFTYTVRNDCAHSPVMACETTADFETVTMLPGGTVVADGKAISTSRPTITIPVSGGTGRYRGAKGSVTISSAKVSTYALSLP